MLAVSVILLLVVLIIAASYACYRLALSYGSKKLKDYTSLGELYIKTDQPEKLSALITELSKDETIPRKEAILRNLKEILATYQ